MQSFFWREKVFVEEYKQKIQPVLENGGDNLSHCTVSEEEQKEAKDYVLHKELIRPTTSFITLAGWFLVACIAAFGLTSLFYLFVYFKLEDVVLKLKSLLMKKSLSMFLVVFLSSFLIIVYIFRNSIAIGFIHLYQHYSPEEKRRSCLFKPTCSEYAIIAINKYDFSRALPKIIDRCKRCHGSVYRIDYP